MSQKKLETLVVTLEAEVAKYKRELAGARKTSKKFVKDTKKDVSDLRGVFAALGAGYAVKEIIDKTAKQEQAFAQLEQGIISTDNAVGISAKNLAKYASDLQGVSTFGDEDIIQAMSQLVTFTNITGEEFKRTTAAALDLSTRMDGDLKGSVVQLGKALNDPVANLSALSKSGIQFSEDQKDLIKTLVESGRQAEAQRVILSELERQFGGSAKAARETFGGAITGLNNAFGDLLESDTGLNAARISIEDLTTTLSDPQVKAGVQELTGAIIGGFAGAASMISTVTNAIHFLAEEFAAWISGPAFGDIPRIEDALDDVNKKIEEMNRLNEKGRSNGGNSTKLRQLEAQKRTLEDMLARSREFEQSRIWTNTGPDIDISGGGNKPGAPVAPVTPSPIEPPGVSAEPPDLDFFEKWAARYEEIAKAPAQVIENAWIDSLDNVTASMSYMLANAIIQGENLRDVFGQVALMLGTQLLGSLIQVGAQMAINKLFAKTSQTEDVASAYIAGPAIASAYAPAAAMVSLATLGANAIPASAAITSTTGLAETMAVVGMAHDGITDIPEEGTWILNKGERVMSKDTNQDFKRYMRNNGGGAQVTNVFQISAGVAGTVRAEIAKTIPQINKLTLASVEQALRSGGSISRAAGVR